MEGKVTSYCVRIGKVESLITVVRVEKVEDCANYRCTCREGRNLPPAASGGK